MTKRSDNMPVIARYKVRQDNLSNRRTDVMDTGSEPRRSICQCWFVEDAEKIARLLNSDQGAVARIAELEAALREASEQLDAAGCQVAASNAHRVVVGGGTNARLGIVARRTRAHDTS